MDEIERNKNIGNMLNDIEKECDAKIVRENVKDLSGIKKLVASFPVYALLNINPINGRIITDSLNEDIEIRYIHKEKKIEYFFKNPETWENMTKEAHLNFYKTLMSYMELQAQDNL